MVSVPKSSDWVRVASGSFGSRGGEPWSRKIAQANDRTKPSDTMAGVHESVVAPSQAALRAAIESQTCPWCGRGPFKVLALHTNKEHGIDRKELRELAGLRPKDSACSPEASANARENLLSRENWEEMGRLGNAQAVASGAHKVAGAALAKKRSEENKARDSAIISAVKSGEGRHAVAARFGVTPHTVARILKRKGIDADGRVLAAKSRKFDPKKLQSGAAVVREASRQARLSRFAELGGTWEAVVAMAEEEGRTRRSMREILKHSGAVLPDGRAETTLKRTSYPTKPKKPCSLEGCNLDAHCRGLCNKHYQNWRYHSKKENGRG